MRDYVESKVSLIRQKENKRNPKVKESRENFGIDKNVSVSQSRCHRLCCFPRVSRGEEAGLESQHCWLEEWSCRTRVSLRHWEVAFLPQPPAAHSVTDHDCVPVFRALAALAAACTLMWVLSGPRWLFIGIPPLMTGFCWKEAWVCSSSHPSPQAASSPLCPSVLCFRFNGIFHVYNKHLLWT